MGLDVSGHDNGHSLVVVTIHENHSALSNSKAPVTHLAYWLGITDWGLMRIGKDRRGLNFCLKADCSHGERAANLKYDLCTFQTTLQTILLRICTSAGNWVPTSFQGLPFAGCVYHAASTSRLRTPLRTLGPVLVNWPLLLYLGSKQIWLP